ncbi:MAG TPA: cysteine-rich small domain-containing protein [Candidatus Monoglobus merdigallinarum]|uniref:Cysteine-rich small domain-containing protein n=1 Tax=Candidatus Monoglobus merdigallinarum TaxID=2838698 RepID=A0A9D1TL58_9FIRM|nr:cysteine-rich small domain-containing protein [Candidatus Monoglobus merdigallinarum]
MSYKFFENKTCEYYPCHKAERINCLFCFCPLYSLSCGGNYKIIDGSNGGKIKDCSGCLLPHTDGGYEYVVGRLKGDNENDRKTSDPERGQGA